jgi:hypothetical protein
MFIYVPRFLASNFSLPAMFGNFGISGNLREQVHYIECSE